VCGRGALPPRLHHHLQGDGHRIHGAAAASGVGGGLVAAGVVVTLAQVPPGDADGHQGTPWIAPPAVKAGLAAALEPTPLLSPLSHPRVSVQGLQVWDATATLVVAVETVQRGSGVVGAVGYALLELFVDDTTEAGCTAPAFTSHCMLNEGHFQARALLTHLVVHASQLTAPGPCVRLGTKPTHNPNARPSAQLPLYMRLPAAAAAGELSAAALQEAQAPRVVCATVLVRVLPAAGSGQRGDPPAYADAVYDSSRCFPSDAEQKVGEPGAAPNHHRNHRVADAIHGLGLGGPAVAPQPRGATLGWECRRLESRPEASARLFLEESAGLGESIRSRPVGWQRSAALRPHCWKPRALTARVSCGVCSAVQGEGEALGQGGARRVRRAGQRGGSAGAGYRPQAASGDSAPPANSGRAAGRGGGELPEWN
jgi:hypothetical protein